MSYEFYDKLLTRLEELQNILNKLRDLIKKHVQALREDVKD